ncbi:MAG: hypothetical protein AAFQ89_15490 [Cyanobacteria bacterium J06626_18]
MKIAVQVPKNRQSRLSDDVWLAAEAMARYVGSTSPRDGLERGFMSYVLDLAEANSKFAAIWESVKEEGIQDG